MYLHFLYNALQKEAEKKGISDETLCFSMKKYLGLRARDIANLLHVSKMTISRKKPTVTILDEHAFWSLFTQEVFEQLHKIERELYPDVVMLASLELFPFDVLHPFYMSVNDKVKTIGLHLLGISQQKIAELLGMTQPNVSYIIKNYKKTYEKVLRESRYMNVSLTFQKKGRIIL